MKIKENLKIRDIAGEKLVILENDQQVEFTRVMVLNKTSEWLWNQLYGKEFDTAQVSGLLQSAYHIDESAARTDALNWIETLKNNGIIDEK